MSHAQDRALVESALGGDAAATRALVERLVPAIEARVTYALSRYKRREQVAQVAPDLTQHVFLMLFEQNGRRLRAWQADLGASLSTFVGLIAEREVIAVLRRPRRNPWTEAPTEHDELARRVGVGGDEEAHVANRQLLDAVLDRTLARLDERGLVLFQRLVVEEADCGEVAREMKMTLAALYMWKSRFAKLAQEIADEIHQEPSRSRLGSMSLQPAWRGR
jgi:DNA-directed RNA polymerase specialized sigma24 family protein